MPAMRMRTYKSDTRICINKRFQIGCLSHSCMLQYTNVLRETSLLLYIDATTALSFWFIFCGLMCPWSIPVCGGPFFVAHTGSASCSLVTRGNLPEVILHGPPLSLFISVITVWMVDNPARQLENIRQALQVEPSFGVGFGWSLRSPLMNWLLWPQQICRLVMDCDRVGKWLLPRAGVQLLVCVWAI